MDLEDAGAAVRYVIRDRDAKFPTLVDGLLADAGIAVVLTGSAHRHPDAADERRHGTLGAHLPT